MSDSLLTISIGPVQEFIAAARKTRDLWFGSKMLSDVSRAAAMALRDEGATLIFPSPDALENNVAVANKLLVLTREDPAKLAELARAAAQNRIREFGEQALGQKGNLRVDTLLVREQLEGLLEFYAAWVPSSPASYAEDRTSVELLLAGRKALRDFAPARGRPGVPKSALDPSRESALDWRKWPPEVQPTAGTRVREQLDGISLTKRLAPTQRFVSVSRVAVDPLIRRLEATDPGALARLREIAAGLRNTGAVEEFSGFQQFEAFPFDTELFYGDDDRVPPERKSEADSFHQVLKATERKQSISEPPAYYAALAADGDHMGALIGGLQSAEAHQQFSKRLVEFAGAAEDIVMDHCGALVYSGGDDVLAFLPMDRALACADALRREFRDRVTDSNEKPATLTVGVAFVHYLEPLADVLTWAREAEKEGKQQRNALSVALHTRSGGQATRGVRSWDVDPVQRRWDRWIQMHREDALPDGAAYELRQLATEMDGFGNLTGVSSLVRDEARRILRRKRAEHGGTPVSAERVQDLIGLLEDPQSARQALRNLANELIIARRVAGAVGIAEGQRESASNRAG